MLRTLIVLILLQLTAMPAQADRPVTVFAAASMREAMERIGVAFQQESGIAVVYSFAGTGTLARQIEAGAPADLFVSADAEWMDYAVERGAVRPDTVRLIASNSLVLIGSTDIAQLDLTQTGLTDTLAGARMAIADPDTVPAGRYGRAALEKLDLWNAVSSQLAPMENVRIVLASVARGDTPLGLVYGTDARIEPDVTIVAELPASAYPEIEYLAALTVAESLPAAGRFLDFLQQPQAQEILRSLGFLTDKVN